jgi:hypothetical protein
MRAGLVLSGCVSASPIVPDLFLAKLRTFLADDKVFEVRTGYFGMLRTHLSLIPY